MASRDQALDSGPQLVGSDGRGVICKAESDRVQDLRPRGTVRGECGNERVRPARVGLSAHNSASVSSKNASARADRHL
ncbi:hypothetical protein [Streptomyces sp. Je 1-369]|uniref:hypothetical protein n=1 Tax=Streptomyces sp. Je 1-369 TaxID=2966192 RepID=UPI0039E0DC5D